MSTDTSQRLITALILAPLVVWGVLALPTPAFAAVLATVLVLGAWEWSRLVPLPAVPLQLGYTLLAAVLFYAVWDSGWHLLSREPLLLAGVVWWLLALIWLARVDWSRGRPLVKGLAAVPALLPAWTALVVLHGGWQGGRWVLYLLMMIWIADSAAYFSGRRFGRHKLAPAISPGKTWEGVAGALLACGLLAAAVSLAPAWNGRQQLVFVLLSLVSVMISIIGDLFVSALKRQAGVKDSSHLIPGHGGVLDRIDSLLAAPPVFVGGLLHLGLMPD